MDKIGLIAGNGRFPFLVTEEIRKAGDQVIAIGLREETDPSLEQKVDKLSWVKLGQFQKIIDILHEEKVTKAIMAGQVKHAQLFAGLSLDWRAIKLMGRLVNKKTDTILGAVCEEFSREGITFLPSHQYLLNLLPKQGLVAGEKLTKEEKLDVEFGHRIAKQIAGLDIGQTVCIKDRAVLAVESIEGTNECIKRAACYAGNGIIVVKVAKPNQDFRFDVPVIGPNTIKTMAELKARVLSVDAESTLLIDRNEVVELAEKNHISIVAVSA